MRKKILAVIGLRSGSKGLKDKNIKDLCGKPLFYYIFKPILIIIVPYSIYSILRKEKFRL